MRQRPTVAGMGVRRGLTGPRVAGEGARVETIGVGVGTASELAAELPESDFASCC